MDEHAQPTSSSRPPSPSSFSAADGDDLVFEFPYTEVPERWLMDNDDSREDQLQEHGAAWGDGGSLSAGSADLSGDPPAAAAATTKRRGRKSAGPSTGPAVSQVEAERHRRDKLHRRFCDLRAAVPTVTRMDKASILADATAYITALRARVDQLQVEATRAAVRRANPFVVDDHAAAAASGSSELEEKLEVRMVAGQEAAALRLTTAARHASARLMDALRGLDLLVQHACVCRVGGVTVQDAVVDVPAELRDEGCLRAALLHRLQSS